MKVGFITRNYPPRNEGGAEISLMLLANALAKKGIEVKIFVPEEQIKKDYIEGENPVIFHFKWDRKTPFGLENPFAVCSFAKKIIKTQEKIDIIDCWNYITPAKEISSQLKIPYIVSIRDTTSLCDLRLDDSPKKLDLFNYLKYRLSHKGVGIKEVIYGLFGYYLTTKRQDVIKRANLVTYASCALEKVYGKINKKQRVIYSIASSQYNYQISDTPANDVCLSAEDGHMNKEKTFIYCGRISAGKGAIWLYDLAKAITQERNDIKFVFVGKGSLNNSDNSNNIKFLGERSYEETLSLIKDSYALIVPSRIFEAFPRSAIEAISFGIPVIGTNTGGIPEAVGKAGIVVGKNNESLRKAIIKLADDKDYYNYLKCNTTNQNLKFTEDIITESVLKNYKEVS